MHNLLILLTVFYTSFSFACFAQDPVAQRDLSGTYTLWRAPETTLKKIVKDGIKVQVSQSGNIVKVFHDFKNYEHDRMDWEYHSGDLEKQVQNLSNAKFGFGGWPDWNTGRYYIEIEEGMLAFFEGNPNYATDGECAADQVKEVTFVLYIGSDKEQHLDAAKIKGKINSMFSEICKSMKSQNPEKKDLRGMSNMPTGAVTDFSSAKKLEGKYYVWRNEQTALRYTYTTGQEVEIEDRGDRLMINGKQLKVKSFSVIFDNNNKFLKIDQLTGLKILKANSVNEDKGYGLGSHYFVEMEDGVIALVRDVGYNWLYKAENCEPNVDNIDYILYRSKEACMNSQLGQVKTKLRKTMTSMCEKYTATIDGPLSAHPLAMPVDLNTDAELDKMAMSAVQNFFQSQGWKDEVVACYVASAEWSKRTEKQSIGGTYKDVVVSRYKNGVVIYKTSTGLYYKRGISFAQNVTQGHLDGVSFQTKTLYCPGILDAGAAPGSEFSLQTMTKEQVDKYISK